MRPFFLFIREPREITAAIVRILFANRVKDDEKYLGLLYVAFVWRKMPWDEHCTYCEKLTWLKVYYNRSCYVITTDKVKSVKKCSRLDREGQVYFCEFTFFDGGVSSPLRMVG